MSDIPGYPIGGVDYPRTIQEFDNWFPSDKECVSYLSKLRWPSGFVCPKCKETKRWPTSRNQMRCSSCQKQTSITAGTIFEGTRKPLRVWFQAMWYVTSQKFGGNALGLKRVLGLGSYQTAWSWLHKMRRAMVRPDRQQLLGKVEVDEAYLGGEEEGVSGRYTEKKALVVIAVEIHDPKGFGRIRIRQVPNASGENLIGFIRDEIQPGSVILTDGWKGYSRLEKSEYIRETVILSASELPAHANMPGVHRVASLLKRWLLGTHQGAVSNKHLDYYLDEFTFRFNRRSSNARGLLFYRLLQQSVVTNPIYYHQIVAGDGDVLF